MPSRFRFNTRELFLAVTTFAFPALFIAVGIEQDWPIIVIGVELAIGQSIGICMRIYDRKSEPETATLRESLVLILGGAIAGIGFAVILHFIVIFVHPLH